jgi:glycerol kinase
VISDPEALASVGGGVTTFEPALEAGRRDVLYAGWKRAVERSLAWESA